jgi:hypothetical protein
LSPENRAFVEAVYSEASENAIVKAHMLIAASPEFHGTNLVRKSGEERPAEPALTSSSKPYKAL